MKLAQRCVHTLWKVPLHKVIIWNKVFQHRVSELFEDVEGVNAIVDDLLIWGKDDEEHDARLKQVLNRAREVNLKFNAKKCRIRQEEVPYVGHVLSKKGLRPEPEMIRAMQATSKH